jgi:hypothetical protein
LVNPMEESVKEYVITELARLTDRDIILKEVCLRQNCFWEEAERLVNRFENENRVQLEKRKSPLLLVLSSLFASAGLVWALLSFYAIMAPIYQMWKEHGGLVDGIVWIYNFWMLFTFLLMGTGMTISGVFGMIHSIKRLKGVEVEESL